MLTESPILLFKSQKSPSHNGQLVPTRLWKVESVAKLYDVKKNIEMDLHRYLNATKKGLTIVIYR